TRSGSGLPCAGKLLGSGGIDTVVVAGEAGLPTTGASSPAVAVVANLTAIAPTASTYLTMYPANQSGHSVSDINLSAGEVVPNLAVVAVDTSGDARNGDVDLFNAAGKLNALIDIEGWFQMTYASGISGIVSDTQTPAQPIANANVTYSGANGTTGSGATTSSAGGAYAFTSVPPGTYTVAATGTGFTSSPPQTVTVTANTVTATNLSLTASSGIGGGVFDTQTPAQPIVGATITYSGTAGNSAAGTTTTGSDGRYTFAGVSPGTYVVASSESGFTSPAPQTVIVTAGSTATANVTLAATSGISGVVSDTEAPSQPVFGATVTYKGTGGDTAGGTTTTNINGDYAFSGVSPGTYSVAVADDGYIAPSPETVTVGVGGVVSQAFALQGDRNPLLQPFTSTSIWNMPVGSDAVYEPANLIPAATQTLVSDQHVIVMTPTAPPMTLVKNPAGGAGGSGQRCDTSGAFLTTAPIPADFYVASSTSNLPLVAVAADARTLIQGEPFAHCLGFADGTLEYLDTNGDLYGDGRLGGDGGSDLSALGGAIRLGELVPGGVIDHALQIDVYALNLYYGSASTCPTWPATVCDKYASPTTYTGTNPDLKMGSLLALPAWLDLNTLGLETQPGMILAKAFQDYGAYIANDAHRSVNNIVTEYGPSGSVADVVNSTCGVVQTGEFDTAWGYPFETCTADADAQWSHDIETIFKNLSIVKNNGEFSIGGGGTPIVPLAPPLAPPPS
ncbi:MAG: carboxypeptidase-like regulatory domain-containing protein, partial [Candidatus Dormiibacterota bacterium]